MFYRKNTIEKHIHEGLQQAYFDYLSPPNLFSLAQKDKHDRIPLKVITKELISPDTYKLELKFPDPNWIGGFWPGAHVIFHLNIDGKCTHRNYTPISAVNVKGYMCFQIKIYRQNKDFPGGGKFT